MSLHIPAMSTIDMLEHRRNRILNRIHTWLLAGGSLFLLAVTAWALGGGAGLVYALVFGGVALLAARRVSPRMVLAMYKARPLAERDFPAGVRIVRELARRARLPAVPTLYIVPSHMMNAFAVGRREDAAIAITDGLARRLTTRELAAVLAHEISHIVHEDLKVMALGDVVARFTSLMSTAGILSLFLNLGSVASGGGQPVPWLAVLVLVAAPTVGGLLQMALSRTREFDADLGAALLTGDPDGLASALLRLEHAQGRLWEGLMLPGSRIPDPSVLRSHPATADRVQRLRALKAATGGPGDKGARDAPPPGRMAARTAFIPAIGRRSLPGVGANISALLADVSRPDPDALELEWRPGDDGRPSCEAPLAPPDGPPRIRLMRGGVWW